MVRNYEITWYLTNDAKYGKTPTFRTNKVTLSKPTGKTSVDARAALGIFIANFGNLKKNTIVKIKEFDENGQIGADITPSDDDTAIVPIRK